MFPSGNNIKKIYLNLLPSGNKTNCYILIINTLRFPPGLFSFVASAIVRAEENVR